MQKTCPHEYLATAKFNSNKFDETEMLEIMPSLSMIKIADYLSKVTAVLNKVFYCSYFNFSCYYCYWVNRNFKCNYGSRESKRISKFSL